MKKYSELFLPSINEIKSKNDKSFIYVDNQGRIKVAENLLLNPDNILFQKENTDYNFKAFPPIVDLLIVGAGGAGGTTIRKGGGGAGGYIRKDSYAMDASIVNENITIGICANNTSNGGSTTAFGITAQGGGKYSSNGASGGGGNAPSANYTSDSGGISTANTSIGELGNNGGTGRQFQDSQKYSSGGGGGASSAGGYYNASLGGRGYKWLDGKNYAGGGGGSGNDNSNALNYRNGGGDENGNPPYSGGRGRYGLGSDSWRLGTNGVANTGGGGGGGAGYNNSSLGIGGSGVVVMRIKKSSTINYTYTGTHELTDQVYDYTTNSYSTSSEYNFLYLKSSGTLNLTFESTNSSINLKNSKVSITSESEFEEILTHKMTTASSGAKEIRGKISTTASGYPLFNAKGKVKIIKDPTTQNIKISHPGKGLFNPLANEFVWKSWDYRHTSSAYSDLNNLIGKIGNIKYDSFPISDQEKLILLESDLNSADLYNLGNPSGTGSNSFRELMWHSVLNGCLADDLSSFSIPGGGNLESFLGINTSTENFARKNIYFFSQFTCLSKMNVILPNPVDKNGNLIYEKGTIISVFVRKHANNPTKKNQNEIRFYNSAGDYLTTSNLTSLNYGEYHSPYVTIFPGQTQILIAVPTAGLWNLWSKFDFICTRSDNSNLLDTWKFIKSGFV